MKKDSTARNIFDTLLNFFNSNEIKIENMAGFAADNCNTMMGHIGGFQSLLRNIVPNLVVVGCSSHSFHLCSSYACEKISQAVEDMVKDIYNHFSHSSKRKNEFKEFQMFCELTPHRW